MAPLVGKGLDIQTNADRADPVNQAVVTAIAMLAGGGMAAALGQNATAAALAAQNEALNNYLSSKQEKGLVDSLKSCAAGDTQCVAKWTSYYASVNTTQQQAAQNCTLDNCTAIANDARAPSINTDANLAACQRVAACESLLSNLQAQNVSAQASALSRWNTTSNEKAQRISQQAAQNSTGSSIWAQMFGQLSPVDASGAVDAMIGAAVSGGGSFWSSKQNQTSVENAYGHWDKHQSEFPEYKNSVQYVQGAQNFVTDPPAGTLIKTRPNGDTLLYNPATNTFATKTADGAPRTMFRPKDGIDYWNKQ
ncbi:hypothetical protein [Cupriavidus plantarum]|uniref:hypothetical protein n=1 Tax=Cupriavidus plantarum TaxID=942865 RepID=UPI00339D37D3